MNPHLAFWTWAQVNLGLVVGLMLYAVHAVRRAHVAAHRRSMLFAASLVALFLVAYLVKLGLLGREDLSTWSSFHVWILRFHELCVLTMIIAGGTALTLGRRLGRTRVVTGLSESPLPAPSLLRVHRRVGKAALFGAIVGWLSAAVVLAGMYARA